MSSSQDFVPEVPGSRSISARALICAALASGHSEVENTPISEDTDAIRQCLLELFSDGKIKPSGVALDCKASGTTMRFIAALSLLTSEELILTGTSRLFERPMDGLIQVLESCGKKITEDGKTRKIFGIPKIPDELIVDASKSGQFVSGLLMALAACSKPTKLIAKNPVSIPFITMTLEVMKCFGARVVVESSSGDLVFDLTGSGYQPTYYKVEPDIMSANYFLAAAALTGHSVFIPNIQKDTIQGDIAMVAALEKMGTQIEFINGGIRSSRDIRHELSGCEVDLSEMPDMSLTIGALAAVAKTPTTMTSASILKFKESDRLQVLITELTKLGAKVAVSEDDATVIIIPAEKLKPSLVNTYEDHRVAMAFGLLTLVEPKIVINDPECVSKTWPDYFAELTRYKHSAADSIMDGGGLSGSHIPMQASEAIELLKSVYGITGELTSLPSEKDDTFKVSVEGIPKYVLKIANPHDPAADLDFQIKFMQHVQLKNPTIPIPDVLKSNTDHELTEIVDRAGQIRQVWAITFLPGKVLDTFELNSYEREKVGEALGKLRLATEGFSHPLENRYIAWDVRQVGRLRPLLDFVDDENHYKNLEAGLDRIASLQPRIDKLRTQVLHNDFSRSNLLGDSNNPDFITGIIDFGDSSRTAIAVEVSTALLHHLPRNVSENPNQDIFESSRDFIRGYLKVADLTPQEIELIPHLTMARVIARALITTRRAQLFPHNIQYILRNTEPGWAQLEWFLARSIDDISKTFV